MRPGPGTRPDPPDYLCLDIEWGRRPSLDWAVWRLDERLTKYVWEGLIQSNEEYTPLILDCYSEYLDMTE